jgi:hypothetical protein
LYLCLDVCMYESVLTLPVSHPQQYLRGIFPFLLPCYVDVSILFCLFLE